VVSSLLYLVILNSNINKKANNSTKFTISKFNDCFLQMFKKGLLFSIIE